MTVDSFKKTVAIIGGGLMGCGIAQVFAAGGQWEVHLYDSYVDGTAMRQRIQGNLTLLLDNSVMTQPEADALLSRIQTYFDLAEAVKTADYVIECIPENMEMKQQLFAKLEALCRRDTILMTNTSVMSITEIASKAQTRDRIVGTHFWNPPYLIPLVEVIKTQDTSDAVMETVMSLLKEAGKHPIRVNRDVPGFVANRLQHALWREAVSIVENGIADAKTVDEAVKMSFGMRLPVLAPLENADMVGTDLTLSIHRYLFPYLENSGEASSLLEQKVTASALGFKSGNGFYSWTEEQIAQKRKELTDHLIRMLYDR